MKNQTISQHKIARYGWLPDLPDYRDHLYAAPVALAGALPAKVDLRAQCPPVYDQGQLGSCTANAIAAAIEFDRLKQKLNDFAPSRLFIYYNERAMEHTIASDSGAQIRDGIKSVGKLGDCPETEWPYVIPKFKTKLKKATSIVGFLNHLQGDLKAKAVEVGCDTVMPRSAFSQSLPNLLRRYGIEEEEEYAQQPM